MTPEQINFVKNELARGVLPVDVKQSLRGNGYQESHIESLFQAASGQIPSSARVPAETPTVSKGKGLPTWAIILIVVVVLILLLPVILIGFIWYAAGYALSEADFDPLIFPEIAMHGGNMSQEEVADLVGEYMSQMTGQEVMIDYTELNFYLIAQSLMAEQPIEASNCDSFRGSNRVECVIDNGYIKWISMSTEDGTYVCVQNNSYMSESSNKPSGPNCPPGGESLEVGNDFIENARSSR